MHYYKRNIGDYAKKAGRLSMLQHGSYTLLIDACYDREQFPTMSEAIDWTWAASAAEIEAVEFVLRKFFQLEDGVYVQTRIQEEVAAYHAVSETNKRIAKERETNRLKDNTKRARSVDVIITGRDEAPPNQEPLTKNQEPVPPKPPTGVERRFEEFWKAYPRKVGKDAVRKFFDKRKPDDEMLAEMLAAVDRQTQTAAWTKDGGQFIPHPSTWLSEGRWQDEHHEVAALSSIFLGAI